MTIHARFTTLIAVAIAAITLSSTHATAQPYIQIDISGTMRDQATGDQYKPFGFRAIFDAGAAPDSVGPNSIHFNAVWGEAIESSALITTTTASSPIGVLSGGYSPADVHFAYIQSSNNYRISAEVNGEFMDLWVTDPIGSFSLAMTSLPDDLGDYQVFFGNPTLDEAGPVIFSMFSPASGDGGNAHWEGDCLDCHNTGTISATFRFVDGPPEPECIADINGDGELNFFDISAYLAEFTNGCP